jgi:hypothetical protein
MPILSPEIIGSGASKKPFFAIPILTGSNLSNMMAMKSLSI